MLDLFSQEDLDELRRQSKDKIRARTEAARTRVAEKMAARKQEEAKRNEESRQRRNSRSKLIPDYTPRGNETLESVVEVGLWAVHPDRGIRFNKHTSCFEVWASVEVEHPIVKWGKKMERFSLHATGEEAIEAIRNLQERIYKDKERYLHLENTPPEYK